MNNQFKLFDIVLLKEKVDNIPKGSQGTIVHCYNSNFFEVEFIEVNKVITVKKNEIEVYD